MNHSRNCFGFVVMSEIKKIGKVFSHGQRKSITVVHLTSCNTGYPN